MRPSIKNLYGVEASFFANMDVRKYLNSRIELLKKRQRNLAEAIRVADDYEELSALNAQYQYVVKALKANEADREEIFG